ERRGQEGWPHEQEMPPNSGQTLLTPGDLESFQQGRHFRAYEKLGAHLAQVNGVAGTFFAVWAPNALRVAVIGAFNNWNGENHPLQPMEQFGVWAGFIPGVGSGTPYKYHIVSRYNGYTVDKADPFAFWYEVPPHTASIV